MSEHKTGGDSISCYADAEWLALAGGLMPAGDEAPLLDHASQCPLCSKKLAESIRLFHSDEAPDEEEMLKTLNTSTPEWQREAGALLAKSVAAAPPSPIRWLPVAAAVLLAVGGAALWRWYER